MPQDRHPPPRPPMTPPTFGAAAFDVPAPTLPGLGLPRFGLPKFGLPMLGMPQLGHPPLGTPPVEASEPPAKAVVSDERPREPRDPRRDDDASRPSARRRWWQHGPPLRFLSAVARRVRPSAVLARHVDRRGRRVLLVRAGASHRDALLQMYREFLPIERTMGLPPVSEVALRAWVDSMLAAEVGIVARVQGRAVGHVMLLPDGQGNGELVVLVHPVFRGAHIGCVLVTTALEQARRRGWARVCVVVEPWNLPAVRLYAHAGFQRASRDRREELWEARLSAAR